METCEFCGLDVTDLFAIYNVMVCFDCTDLAEMAYEEEETF